MKKNDAIFYGIIGIFVVATVGLLFFSGSPGKYDEFAKCLSEKGAKFYGAFWCPHCNDQKQLFESSIKYVNYIECSTPDGRGQTSTCMAANIQTYPTWGFIDGSRVTGEMTFQALSAKTGCII